jgi:hypothetical protein
MCPDDAWNQEQLCWREPAAIYWTDDLHGLDTQGFGVRVPLGAWFF